MNALTLDQIHNAIGGIRGSDRVTTALEFGAVSASVQIFLDATAPDGVRVDANPRIQARCDDIMRVKLGLPLRWRPANDDAPPENERLPIIDPTEWQGKR